MNWKLKAIIQNAVDCLPNFLAYQVYYKIQRKFGNLRKICPFNNLNKSAQISKLIIAQDREVTGGTFLEVGTGRTLDVPLGLWLCGASKIITVDKNPYIKEELIRESLVWIKNHRDKIRNLFGKLLYNDWFDGLISVCSDIDSLLKLTNIEYCSNIDAAFLPLENNSVDYHFSINTFEHIPHNGIENILLEGKRILNADGLLIHFIDLSDHFSHDDESITSIIFFEI